jgi:ribosomal protein S18 acetylase RimI-like enzyme
MCLPASTSPCLQHVPHVQHLVFGISMHTACSQDSVVGFVLCLQKCAYLCNMAVSKQWQRRGIASQLMVAVEDLCLLAGKWRR